MSEKIVQLNKEVIEDLVRSNVEENPNSLLGTGIEKLTEAANMSSARSGVVLKWTLQPEFYDNTQRFHSEHPLLKEISFEIAIIERYRHPREQR